MPQPLPAELHLVAAARPNLPKLAALWHAIPAHGFPLRPVLVHTGQHHDPAMFGGHLRDLGLPGYLLLPTDVAAAPAQPPTAPLAARGDATDPAALAAFRDAAARLVDDLDDLGRMTVLGGVMVHRTGGVAAFSELLAAGDLFLQKLVKVLPRPSAKRTAVEVAREVEASVSTYLITTALLNAAEGLVVAGALALLASGRLDWRNVVTHRFPLDEFDDALRTDGAI